MDNIVTCKLIGYGQDNSGLGNQLFCIATTLGLAWDNGVRPVFSMNHRQAPYSNTIFKKLPVTNHIDIQNRYKEPSFEYNKIPYSNNLCIEGYWQSEKYFLNHRDRIIELIGVSENGEDYIKKKYGDIFDDTISVHIRRGDYKGLQNHHPMSSVDYYQKALSHFADKEYKVLVFSDDIEWCKENFDDGFIFIEDNPDYIDMWIMSMCTHNIITNSSFSWWGAWLNTNSNKKVIAPEKWFGSKLSHNDTKDLYPPTWNIIKENKE
jgi:hypothetical protein